MASSDIQAIHDEANRRRGECGLSPLTLDVAKCLESQKWADYMATSGRFHHGGGEEIIAYASWKQTPAELVSSWLSSPGHAAWILSPSVTIAGWGQASGGTAWYWSGSFDGSPAGGPVSPTPPNRPVKRSLWSWLLLLWNSKQKVGDPLKSLVIALCVVLGAMCVIPPAAEAGPLVRGVRCVVAHRREARQSGQLPRQRLFRCVFGGCCS